MPVSGFKLWRTSWDQVSLLCVLYICFKKYAPTTERGNNFWPRYAMLKSRLTLLLIPSGQIAPMWNQFLVFQAAICLCLQTSLYGQSESFLGGHGKALRFWLHSGLNVPRHLQNRGNPTDFMNRQLNKLKRFFIFKKLIFQLFTNLEKGSDFCTFLCQTWLECCVIRA